MAGNDGELNRVRISPHFMLSEFQCRCCGRVMISARLLEMLETLRALCRRPLIITSGYRCRAHNEAVGGALRSAHMSGRAADISAPDAAAQDILAGCARTVGFRGIIKGEAKKYVHLGLQDILD
jgi:hypothetical protein